MGHIHKDIDAHFSYLSQLIKKKNTYALLDLMKAFMDSLKTIFEFVQEVVHFEAYIVDFHRDGVNKIEGLEELHLLEFNVKEDEDDIGW